MKTIAELYTEALPESRQLYERAAALLPGGVTHDGRHLEPFPLYVTHAQGSKKWDPAGREYIDYWVGHGALLLGHNRPEVVEAVQAQLRRGTHYGASHELEIEWAQLVVDLVPSAEKVRFTSSGTEATMMALRLARTFTGKDRILKFEGHFHGWHDALMIAANPPFDAPVPGIPAGVVENTVVCPPNDLTAVEAILQADGNIAAVILEPTGASAGTIPTGPDFLRGLRDLTQRYGVLLIFDEVITGFRCAPGGAQEAYGLKPDLTTLAKVLAGGLPGGAVAGRADVLELLECRSDPSWKQRKMPHPGTFNANPLSASAGLAALKLVQTGQETTRANELAAQLRRELNQVIDRHSVPWCVYGEFSMFKFLPNHDCPKRGRCDYGRCDYDYHKLKAAGDPGLAHDFRCAMILHGVDLPRFSGMTSSAHTAADVEKTAAAFDATLGLLQEAGQIPL